MPWRFERLGRRGRGGEMRVKHERSRTVGEGPKRNEGRACQHDPLSLGKDRWKMCDVFPLLSFRLPTKGGDCSIATFLARVSRCVFLIRSGAVCRRSSIR